MKRNILAGFILLVSLSAGIGAQVLDQDCNLVEPPECQGILGSIKLLDDRIARFQERLRNAAPAMKAGLLRSIDQLNTQRATARADLLRCRREHGPTPPELAPAELTSTFTGKASLRTTDRDAPGPFDVDFEVDIRFSRNRCIATITRFPPITLTTPDLDVVGVVTIRVTKTGGGTGTFHPVSGTMSLPLTLHFHYETDLAGDDDATFNLTTGRSLSRDGTFDVTGSALNADGRIRLVGTTRFRKGYLARKYGSLIVSANISPRP